MRTYKGLITKLKDNEVFVFGANSFGYHGAGAAAYATCGAMRAPSSYYNTPNGTKGKWNIKGHTGHMQGQEGQSYGLVTIIRPGKPQSLDKRFLADNIEELYEFAEENPKLDFKIAQSCDIGLCGYTPYELAELYAQYVIPPNIIFEEGFAEMVEECIEGTSV
jgi:hypothetical protein